MDFIGKNVDILYGTINCKAKKPSLGDLIRSFSYIGAIRNTRMAQYMHGRVTGMGIISKPIYVIPELDTLIPRDIVATAINPLWDKSHLDEYDSLEYEVERALYILPKDKKECQKRKLVFVPKCKITTIATKESVKYFFDFITMSGGMDVYVISAEQVESNIMP
jgi:hypothetical protein